MIVFETESRCVEGLTASEPPWEAAGNVVVKYATFDVLIYNISRDMFHLGSNRCEIVGQNNQRCS